MKLIDLKQVVLPAKNYEEFRKIDFSPLYNHEFKNVQKLTTTYPLDVSTTVDKNSYESSLFEVVKAVEENQEVLIIKESTKEPIILMYDMTKEATLYTHSVQIVIEKGVKAHIIEVFKTEQTNSAGLVNRTFCLKEDADLIYAKIQDVKEGNSLIYNVQIQQHSNSLCELSHFEFGDGFIVNNYENNLKHKNAHYILNALVKLTNESFTANLIKTQHSNENSLSDINVKHTLEKSATAVFKAKSIVDKNALYTKAFQNSDTILLSNDATIFAQPHLEIAIDELEASHGATTGTLDANQLLYLQTRGISEELAYSMLLNAFEDEIYNNISDETLKSYVKAYKGGKDV